MARDTYILGISAHYHDSAAALVKNGVVVAAAQEERFSRIKFDSSFPVAAATYCLAEAGIDLGDVAAVAFYEDPALKLDRITKTFLQSAPRGFSTFASVMGAWLRGKAFTPRRIAAACKSLPGAARWNQKLEFVGHHDSHAASAFYPSSYQDAAILTIDGVGEWDTTTISKGSGDQITTLRKIKFPHSIGLLYATFTAFLGFRVNSDEYKVMGLAPFGQPRFADVIRDHLIQIAEDGSYQLNMRHFSFSYADQMYTRSFAALFPGLERKSTDPLLPVHADLAASLQAVTEDVVLRLARTAVTLAGSRNLCLAGGVSLNCVANGKILQAGLVDSIFIQPAAGDAGGALGAALWLAHKTTPGQRVVQAMDAMNGSRLGPQFTTDEIEAALGEAGVKHDRFDDENACLNYVADALAKGEVVAWFDGRMEYGPRALGGRSILADPRNVEMQSQLNLMVKFRESFRPFAPIILKEDVSDWFETVTDSPYMLLVTQIKQDKRLPLDAATAASTELDRIKVPRSVVPAITHVDYSARVQTVDSVRNPRLYRLLQIFKKKTGCPILVNTSFNVADEPIVCTPHDAIACFLSTSLQVLVMGNCVVRRDSQAPGVIIATLGRRRARDRNIDDFNYTLH